MPVRTSKAAACVALLGIVLAGCISGEPGASRQDVQPSPALKLTERTTFHWHLSAPGARFTQLVLDRNLTGPSLLPAIQTDRSLALEGSITGGTLAEGDRHHAIFGALYLERYGQLSLLWEGIQPGNVMGEYRANVPVPDGSEDYRLLLVLASTSSTAADVTLTLAADAPGTGMDVDSPPGWTSPDPVLALFEYRDGAIVRKIGLDATDGTTRMSGLRVGGRLQANVSLAQGAASLVHCLTKVNGEGGGTWTFTFHADGQEHPQHGVFVSGSGTASLAALGILQRSDLVLEESPLASTQEDVEVTCSSVQVPPELAVALPLSVSGSNVPEAPPVPRQG